MGNMVLSIFNGTKYLSVFLRKKDIRMKNMRMKNIENDRDKLRTNVRRGGVLFEKFLIGISPFLIILFFLFYKDTTIFQMKMQYNDEIIWFKQVEAVVNFGSPLGYYGYNGSHAALGTFGAWGWSILIPYVIVGKIIGWNSYTPMIANIIFLCGSNVIFIALTQPKRKNLFFLGLANLFLYVNIYYSFTAMAECIRYAYAIILAGMLYNFIFLAPKGKVKKWICYFFFVLTTVLAMLSYILFSAVLPVYAYGIYKKNKKFQQKKVFYWSTVFLITIGLTGIIYYTNMLFSSPYPVSQINLILNGFKTSFADGVRYLCSTFFVNMQSIDIFSIIKMIEKDNGFVSFNILLYYFMMGIVFVRIVICCHKKIYEDIEINIIAFYMMAVFFFGFVILYTTSVWTFIRGCNIGLIFLVYLLTLNKGSVSIKMFVLYSIVGFFSFISIVTNTINTRINPQNFGGTENYIEIEKTILSDYIDIQKQYSRWENTIAVYGELTNLYLAMPEGAGMNYMLNNQVNIKSKYAAVVKNNEETQQRVASLLIENNTYKIIYEDKFFIIFQNTSY